MEDIKNYKYLDQYNDDFVIHQKDGQIVSGYPIGIIVLNVKYPIVLGNVACASTFPFPVRYTKVIEVTSPRLHAVDPTIIEDLVKAGKELENDGVRAIICSCGYFGYYQEELADRLDVPVFASSLLQLPLIKASLKKNQKIGVFCAVTRTFTPKLLECCGVEDDSYLVIQSMEDFPEFSAIPRDRPYMNNAVVRQELIDAAKKLVADNPDIGAILLECSDMPPYASAIQAAVNLPVFDFVSLITWVHSAVAKKPYQGFV